MGGVDDIEVVQPAALRRNDVAARMIVELARDLAVRLVRSGRQHRYAPGPWCPVGVERVHLAAAIDVGLLRNLERIGLGVANAVFHGVARAYHVRAAA